MRTVVPKLSSFCVVLSMVDMNALQNSAFGQRIAAWRGRDDAHQIKDVNQFAEVRFAVDRSRSRARSTAAGSR